MSAESSAACSGIRGAVVEKPAKAWIHRRCKHESRGEGEGHGSAGNANRSIFERLPHDFEHIARKLGQFVQKKNSV